MAQHRYSLLSRQTLMWLGQQRHPEVPLYNMAMVFHINGALDVKRYTQAFDALVASEDALRFRIGIDADSGEAYGLIDESCSNRLEHVDLADYADADDRCRAACDALARTYIDPTERCYRSVLYRLNQNRWVWVLVQHHIATDITSFALLYERLQAHYGAAAPPPTPSYADYLLTHAAGANRKASSAARTGHSDYWQSQRRYLDDAVTGYGDWQTTASERVEMVLSATQTDAMRALATSMGALNESSALFALLSLVAQVFASRVHPALKVGLAFPQHNRTTRRERAQTGLLVDLAWMGTTPDPQHTLLSACRQRLAAMHNAMRYPAEDKDTIAINAAGSVVCNHITQHFTTDFAGLPCRATWLHCGHQDANHLLRLHAFDINADGRLTLAMDLLTNRFDAACRAAVPDALRALIDQVTTGMNTKVGDLSLLHPEQTQAWLGRLSGAKPDAPQQTIIERFADSATRCANSVALVSGEQSWRYGELGTMIAAAGGRLASLLGEHHATVVVCLPRDARFVVCAYAVWTAGATLVPIDDGFSATRCRQMIDQLRNATRDRLLIITQREDLSLTPDVKRVDPSELLSAADTTSDVAWVTPIPPDAGAEDDAYIIFTSGSSGVPKGVRISHRAIGNYLTFATRHYRTTRSVRMPLCTSIGFDLTLTSLLLPLTCGGELHVYPQRSADIDTAVVDVMRERRVNLIKLTPSHLNLIDDHTLARCEIERFIVGGEDLSRDHAQRITRLLGNGVDIINEYGPTEATIGCTVHHYEPAQDRDASVPIGKAIDHTQTLVVDPAGQCLPAGIRGELYIAGRGLATGYLTPIPADDVRRDILPASANDHSADNSRFLRHPLADGEACYRSGDMVTARPDGSLLYHGREDQQYKIRGIRIEAAEIEAALRRADGVGDAVVSLISYPRSNAAASVQHASPQARFCVRCGLSDAYPSANVDDEQVCALCRAYDKHKSRIAPYFKTERDLASLADAVKQQKVRQTRPESNANGLSRKTTDRIKGDCVALYSGGKDSTYMLYRLCDLGLRPVVITLDNGYISPHAKRNIDLVVADLALEHRYVSTVHMPTIFADSLARHSNVCNGCFKTIYTLALEFADRHDLSHIFTGLSRGQLFETRLDDLFDRDDIDVDAFDDMIHEARLAYHSLPDAVTRCLGQQVIADNVLSRVDFVDFYRYVDVSLSQVMDFLARHTPWQRPPDTGRSTNCLINETGIYVHQRERGFHNYALAYSWDVRLGHKRREQALAELDDDIDQQRVHDILREVGYAPDPLTATTSDGVASKSTHALLTAWLTTHQGYSETALRNQLADDLPAALIPARFIEIDRIPLNANGKADLAQLRKLASEQPREHVAAVGSGERSVLDVWRTVFENAAIGVTDDFFSLGGDSLAAVRISQALAEQGRIVDATHLFKYSTVRALTEYLDTTADALAERSSGQSPVAKRSTDVNVALSADELADIATELGE